MSNPLADFFAELEADAKAALAAAEAEVQADWQKVKPVLKEDLIIVFRQLKSLAIQTVIELGKAEFDALTGQEKQGQVVTKVFQHAEANGIALGLSDAQLLGQQAYYAVAGQ